jgi:hypothetical protein
VDAPASSRIAAVATSLCRAGVVMVGASGQRIIIKLGLSAGWTKTISMGLARRKLRFRLGPFGASAS